MALTLGARQCICNRQRGVLTEALLSHMAGWRITAASLSSLPSHVVGPVMCAAMRDFPINCGDGSRGFRFHQLGCYFVGYRDFLPC